MKLSSLLICLALTICLHNVTSRKHLRRLQAPVAPAPATTPAQTQPAASGSANASGSTSGTVHATVTAPDVNTIGQQTANAVNNAVSHGAAVATHAVINPANSSLFAGYSWYRWVYGIVSILIGIPLCFFGEKWWKFTCFIVAALCGWIGVQTFLAIVKPQHKEDWYIWLGIGLIIAGALAVALIFMFCRQLGGGIQGALLALILYNVIGVALRSWIGHDPAWWVSLIIFILLLAGGIVYGCWQNKDITILCTSVAGGYHITAGVGVMTEQFPYPVAGTHAWVMWIYIVAAIILVVVGFFIQCKNKKKEGEAEVVGGVQAQVTVDIS